MESEYDAMDYSNNYAASLLNVKQIEESLQRTFSSDAFSSVNFFTGIWTKL